VVYAAPPAPDRSGAADGALPETAGRPLRMACAAYLLTQGISARSAAARCGVAPSTLGDRLRAAGNDAALLYQQARSALAPGDLAALDDLITRWEVAP